MSIDPNTGMWVQDTFHGSPGPGNDPGLGTMMGMFNIMQGNKLYDENEGTRLLNQYLKLGQNPRDTESLLGSQEGQDLMSRTGLAPQLAQQSLEPWHQYQQALQDALAQGTPEAYTNLAVQYPQYEKGVLGPMATVMRQSAADRERAARQQIDLQAKEDRLNQVLTSKEFQHLEGIDRQNVIKLVTQGYTPDQAMRIVSATGSQGADVTDIGKAPVAASMEAQRLATANERQARANMLTQIAGPTALLKMKQAGLADVSAQLKQFMLAYQKGIGVPLTPDKLMQQSAVMMQRMMDALRNPRLDPVLRKQIVDTVHAMPDIVKDMIDMATGSEEGEPGPPTDRDTLGNRVMPQQSGVQASPSVAAEVNSYLNPNNKEQ